MSALAHDKMSRWGSGGVPPYDDPSLDDVDDLVAELRDAATAPLDVPTDEPDTDELDAHVALRKSLIEAGRPDEAPGERVVCAALQHARDWFRSVARAEQRLREAFELRTGGLLTPADWLGHLPRDLPFAYRACPAGHCALGGIPADGRGVTRMPWPERVRGMLDAHRAARLAALLLCELVQTRRDRLRDAQIPRVVLDRDTGQAVVSLAGVPDRKRQIEPRLHAALLALGLHGAATVESAQIMADLKRALPELGPFIGRGRSADAGPRYSAPDLLGRIGPPPAEKPDSAAPPLP